jgi:hypothetical protein
MSHYIISDISSEVASGPLGVAAYSRRTEAP